MSVLNLSRSFNRRMLRPPDAITAYQKSVRGN